MKQFVSRAFACPLMTCALLLAAVSVMNAQTAALKFQSGGKSIRADWYHTNAAGAAHPTIIYVHGMDGMLLFPQSYTWLSMWLSAQGYDVYVIHYFDRTGTTFADPLTLMFNYGTWSQTINDGIQWVAKQPATDPNRIGLMSVSLGSFLALSVAEQNAMVKAVSETSGALINPNPTRLPPTLIIHGSADTIVPPSSAEQLAGVLKKLNVPYELQVYPGQGHLGFQLNDQFDALWRSVTFFNQHLKP